MPIQPKLLIELAQAGRLPASRLSPGALRELQTPLDAGLLARRRHGGGEVYAVISPDGFRSWLDARFPGLFGQFGAESPRAANLAATRDSKRGRRGLDRVPVLARAHGPCPALATIVEATALWGGVVLILELGPDGGFDRGPALPPGLRAMTVENPEIFHHSEDLRTCADLFLLCGTGGRLPEAFIQWLGAQDDLQVVHFGDFDPVGLQDYTRLLARMPGRVDLHLPGELEGLFRRFSNRGLLDKDNNRAILAGLERGVSPAMDRVLELILTHGPLEQEAIRIR